MIKWASCCTLHKLQGLGERLLCPACLEEKESVHKLGGMNLGSLSLSSRASRQGDREGPVAPVRYSLGYNPSGSDQ